jgi:hypothetical protein
VHVVRIPLSGHHRERKRAKMCLDIEYLDIAISTAYARCIRARMMVAVPVFE